MLKRYQILLNSWQAEHYKRVSTKYDVSFSEMVRLALCIDMLKTARINYPDHTIDLNEKELNKIIAAKELEGKIGAERFHSFISKVYFEARKVAELSAEDFGRKAEKKKSG